MLVSSSSVTTCQNRSQTPRLLLPGQALLTDKTIGRFFVLAWSFWSLPLAKLAMLPLVAIYPIWQSEQLSIKLVTSGYSDYEIQVIPQWANAEYTRQS